MKGLKGAQSEDIVKLAGSFTSPHVYPQALLMDQKVSDKTPF